MLSRRRILTGIKRRRSMMRYARPLLALTLVLTVIVGVLRKVEAADGDLDPSFNTDGKVTTNFTGTNDQGRGVAIQTDGKIVVAGFVDTSAPSATSGAERDFALARYETDGDLDPTFGTGGRVVTDFGSFEEGLAVAIQTDGKIVVAGRIFNGKAGNDFAVARYNTNGSLDDGTANDSTPGDSFGVNGLATTNISGDDVANAVLIQTDGKIVAAGRAGFSNTDIQTPGATNGGTIGRDFALARYNTNGSADDGSAGDSTPGDSFGNSGVVTTDFNFGDDEAFGVALQTDNKIVAAGSTIAGPAPVANGDGTGFDFALARYNTDGSLDAAPPVASGDPPFGVDGKVVTNFNGADDVAHDVVIQTDGKIVAGGYAVSLVGDGEDFALARYNMDGSLDGGFGAGGKQTTDFSNDNDRANGIVIQTDDKIVLAGYTNVPPAGSMTAQPNAPEGISDRDFALARYNADGSLDDGTANDSTPGDSFGTGGKVTTDFFEGIDQAFDVALQTDGKIVAAGNATNVETGSEFAVARYLNGASADLSVDVTDSADPVFGGKNITYRVKVTNNGPSTATNVMLIDRSPRSSQFVGVTTTRGSCSENDTVITCNLGTLTNGQMAIVNITVRTLTVGNTIYDAEARVMSDQTDPNPSNNTDFESTRVIDLRKLSFSPPIVTGGCQNSVGTLLLTSAAPEGGLKLNLSDNSASTDVPSMITVPGGQTSVNFNVTTHMVNSERIVTIKAFMGTNSIEARIKLLPVRISTLTLSPNPVHGGMNATGTVTLTCAPDQNVVVKLSSNKTAAKPAVSQITIPAGQTSGQFTINTLPVTSQRDVTITAMANGASKSAVQHVIP